MLVDFARWPNWNRDVKAMLSSPEVVAVGSVFRSKAAPIQVISTLVEVDPSYRITGTGRTMGVCARDVWRLEGAHGAGAVHTEEVYQGLVARLFRRALARRLEDALEQRLARLKDEVEGRPAVEMAR